MKKFASIALGIFASFAVCSCNNEDVIEPVVSDTQTDMEVLSRFVDVNEATNEYYINENKKTRALSYVTGSDWEALEKVSPLSVEKFKGDLEVLNAQVAAAISDPGKTLVKKVKENVGFGFSAAEGIVEKSRAMYPKLSIFGGSPNATTGVFYDSSRTLNMDVAVNNNIRFTY